MVKRFFKTWPIILLVAGLSLSGCASSGMNTARKQHSKGNSDMAQDFLLKENEESMRIDAANLVGRIGRESNGALKDSAGEMLLLYIDEPNVVVRNAVIENLGIMGYLPAVEKMAIASLSADSETIDEIAFALQTLGRPAVLQLIEMISTSPGRQQAERYSFLLLQINRNLVLPLLIQQVKSRIDASDEMSNVQQLILIIALIDDARSAAFLQELKDHHNPVVSDAAQSALDYKSSQS